MGLVCGFPLHKHAQDIKDITDAAGLQCGWPCCFDFYSGEHDAAAASDDDYGDACAAAPTATMKRTALNKAYDSNDSTITHHLFLPLFSIDLGPETPIP